MLKGFIISLPDKQYLKDKMFNVKEYFGTNFTFYNGVRLTEGEFKNMVINNEISPFYSGGRKDIKGLIGECGAWKAHRNLWKFIIDNKIKKSFIMEDGSIFDELAFEKMKTMINNCTTQIAFFNNETFMSDGILGGFGLNGYMITNKSAKILLELTKSITQPLDLMVVQMCRNKTLTYTKFIDCVKKDRSVVHSTSDVLIDQNNDFSSKQDFRTLIERFFILPQPEIKIKSSKPKIAFCATHPYLATGYAKVGYEFTKHLADYYEVLYLAFQYSGKEVEDRDLDTRIRLFDLAKLAPNSSLNFGFPAIKQILEDEEPEYLMIYNDYSIILEILKTIPNYKGKLICYLDLVYNHQSYEGIGLIKQYSYKTFVFTEHFKNHLINDYGFEPSKVGVINHGLREMTIHKNPRQRFNIDISDFIVLNINRNSCRKRFETTIHAFLEFWKRTEWDSRIKLQLSCPLTASDGLNIIEYINVLTKKYKRTFDELSVNIMNTSNPQRLPDEIIDNYFQVADVVITSSIGEGWSLLPFEAAYFGKHIIATDLEVHKEILEGYENVVFIEKNGELYEGSSLKGVIPTYNYMDFADAMYTKFMEWDNEGLKEYDGKWLKDKYEWSNIVQKFVNEIDLII
jgi:glycosyltransferase involved in cell wall biosynthesis